ncbi:hypothetical protein K438DRAFT_1976645 [Mycena galopus ATCC 62051]|nr:hypothetical protein K438DRAFT_1976645 [Mycena galopus ATCC 62051]
MSAFPREFPPEIFESNMYAIVRIWAFAAVETFLYGAYLILIAFYVNVLRIRGLGQNRLLASATMVLFVLCTAHCALVVAVVAVNSNVSIGIMGEMLGDTSSEALQLEPTEDGLSLAANVVYVTANVLADAIFIFRCYAIWNFRLKIILFPILLTFCVAALGYYNAVYFWLELGDAIVYRHLFDVSIGVSFFTTFILMGLTVGRIWWLARSARQVIGDKIASTYHTICAMLLESGALYLCGGLAFLSITCFAPHNIAGYGVGLGQLVGIAPTIIAVRVGRGQSVENVNSFIVPKPHLQSPSHHKAATAPVNSVEEEILYICPESVKLEAV